MEHSRVLRCDGENVGPRLQGSGDSHEERGLDYVESLVKTCVVFVPNARKDSQDFFFRAVPVDYCVSDRTRSFLGTLRSSVATLGSNHRIFPLLNTTACFRCL